MDITTKAVSPGVNVVTFNGALNARSAEDAKQTFRDLAGQGVSRVVVDLQNVPFIDSSGLAALVSGLKTFGGEAANLKLAAPQSQARLLFELTMFDRVFEIYETVDEALDSLTEPAEQ
ncbi:MAG: anti-sigma factor antagonist [Chloroflexi bacterium]|nr:MAG: anti-sigma factor antagonist [Chloroflexota bacterium]